MTSHPIKVRVFAAPDASCGHGITWSAASVEVKVDSSGNDEVAVLAHAFNAMVVGLQEGSVYRDLLGRTKQAGLPLRTHVTPQRPWAVIIPFSRTVRWASQPLVSHWRRLRNAAWRNLFQE